MQNITTNLCANDYLRPILARTIQYFESELKLQITKQKICDIAISEINIAIDLYGDISGSYIMCVDDEFASIITTKYINDTNIDGISNQDIITEILNVILGNAMYNIANTKNIYITPPIQITQDTIDSTKIDDFLFVELYSYDKKIILGYINNQLSS